MPYILMHTAINCLYLNINSPFNYYQIFHKLPINYYFIYIYPIYYLFYSFLMNTKKINTTEKVVEKGEFFNIFFDNSANQLEDQFFLSKKKYLNALKGQSELFDMLKLKLKGLDMLHSVLHNNKSLIQKEEISCIEPLANLLTLSKNNKNLFTPILKK